MSLQLLTEQVEEIVASLLPKDPDSWCARYKDKGKIIHDSLWGTFELRDHEIAILDTPLLQRLRFIHQTGAVYLTYPSAVHSRFEHTIGVFCQAARMCDVFRKRGDRRVGESEEANIRAAALLHDTGHGPFSHTSEQFFSALDDIAVAEQEPLYENSGAGEIISHLIVTSKALRGFVGSLNDKFKQAIDCDFIGALITGTTADDRMYLSEFIHGPFDADKLDYMHRDGLFSGLRMHVDLDRLYSSMRIKTGKDGEQTMTRLAGSVVGTSPLTQIMFNKMLLFTGIYHHHKVRTVDCMLWALIDLAVTREARLGGVKLQGAVDFLRLTDDRVLIPELTDDEDIKGVINRIRDRDLWRRALVISRRTVPPSMHEEAGENEKGLWAAFVQLQSNHPAHIKRRREIADRIWERAGQPCGKHEVWLDVPKLPSMDEAKRMWIEAPGATQPETLEYFLPITSWVELYGAHKWQAHVICPAESSARISKAAKEELYDRFGLEFNNLATDYAHITND